VPETEHTVWSRDHGSDSAAHTDDGGVLNLGGDRRVELPPGTRGGFTGDGELHHVELPDGTVYHRTLDGGWSAPRAETGDMLAIKTIDSVTVKLADGREITLPAGSDMITDRNVSHHSINGDGKNPADAVTPADPNRPAGLGDLDEVNKRGTSLTAIRGKGEDGQVHTVAFGKDGWTEVDVYEAHYQATLAAAEKHTDVAQYYLRLAERKEELEGLDTEGLKSLLHGPGSSADDQLAALHKIGEREQGKSARWVQVASVKKLLNGRNVNMDAGEGKTLVFQMAVALKALRVSGEGEGAIFVTSRDYLAEAAHDTFSVLQKYGFKVVKVSQHEEIPLPVKGEPTIYVSSLQEHAFNILGFKSKQPDVHGFFDEQDESMFYVHQSFIKNNGPGTPAPPTVRGPLEWDDRFVRSLNDSDFVHEPGGNFHLTPSGMAKLKEALGGVGEPPAERVSSLEQALYAHHGLREDTHYVVNEFDDEINLIDPVTGKVSVDDGMGVGATRFRGGLHQRLEVKHGTMVRDDSPEGTDDELTQREYFNTLKSVVGASGTNMGKQAHYDAMRPSDEPSGDVYKAPRFYGRRTEKLPSVMASDRADKFDQVADSVIARAERRDATLALFSDNRDLAPIAEALTAKGFTKFTLADAKWFVKQNHYFKVGASEKTADQALRDVIDKSGGPGQVTISGMINRGGDPPVANAVRKQGGGGTVHDSSPHGADVDTQAAARFGRNGDPSTDQSFDDPSSPVFTDSHNPNVPIAIYQYKRAVAASHPDDVGARPGTKTPHDGVSVRGSETSDDGVSVHGSQASDDSVIADDEASSAYSVASHSTATSHSSVSSPHSAGSFDQNPVGSDAGHQLRHAGQRLLDLIPTLQAEAFHQRLNDGVLRHQDETFEQLRTGLGQSGAPTTPASHATPVLPSHATPRQQSLANDVDNLLGSLSRQLGRSVATGPVNVQRELSQLHQAVTHWAREAGITSGQRTVRGAKQLPAELRQRMANKSLLVATAARPGDTPALTTLKSAAAELRIGAQAIRAGATGPGGPAAHLGTVQARAAPATARTEQDGSPAPPHVTVGEQSFSVRTARANGNDVSFRFGQPTPVGVGPRAGGGFFTAMYESARLQGFGPMLADKGITSARELRQAALDAYAAEPVAPGGARDGPLHGLDAESLDYWMEDGARRATELAYIARDEGFAEATATVIHEARYEGTRLGALLPLITAGGLGLPLTMVVSSTAGTTATALGQEGERQIFVGYDSAQRSWRILVPAEIELLPEGRGAVLTSADVAAGMSKHVPSVDGWFTVAGSFDAAAGLLLGTNGRALSPAELAGMLEALPGWGTEPAQGPGQPLPAVDEWAAGLAESVRPTPQVILLASGAAASADTTAYAATLFAAELAEVIGGSVLGSTIGIQSRPGTSEVTLTEPTGWQLHRVGETPRSYQGRGLVDVLGALAADQAGTSDASPVTPAIMVTPLVTDPETVNLVKSKMERLAPDRRLEYQEINDAYRYVLDALDYELSHATELRDQIVHVLLTGDVYRQRGGAPKDDEDDEDDPPGGASGSGTTTAGNDVASEPLTPDDEYPAFHDLASSVAEMTNARSQETARSPETTAEWDADLELTDDEYPAFHDVASLVAEMTNARSQETARSPETTAEWDADLAGTWMELTDEEHPAFHDLASLLAEMINARPVQTEPPSDGRTLAAAILDRLADNGDASRERGRGVSAGQRRGESGERHEAIAEQVRALIGRWAPFVGEQDRAFRELASSLADVIRAQADEAAGFAAAAHVMVVLARELGMAPDPRLLADAVDVELAWLGRWDHIPAGERRVAQAIDSILERPRIDYNPDADSMTADQPNELPLERPRLESDPDADPVTADQPSELALERPIPAYGPYANPTADYHPNELTLGRLTEEILQRLGGTRTSTPEAGPGVDDAWESALARARPRAVPLPPRLDGASARELAHTVNALMRERGLPGGETPVSAEEAHQAYETLVRGPLLSLPAVDLSDGDLLTGVIAAMLAARAGERSPDAPSLMARARRLVRQWWPFRLGEDQAPWHYLAAVAYVHLALVTGVDGQDAAVDLAMRISEAGLRILPARSLAGLVDRERQRLSQADGLAGMTESQTRLAFSRLVDEGEYRGIWGEWPPDWEDLARTIAERERSEDIASALPWLEHLPVGRNERDMGTEGYPIMFTAQLWAARVALALRGQPIAASKRTDPWEVLTDGHRDQVHWRLARTLADVRTEMALLPPGTLGLVRWEHEPSVDRSTVHQWLVAVRHPDPGIGALVLDGGTGSEANDPDGERTMWFTALPGATLEERALLWQRAVQSPSADPREPLAGADGARAGGSPAGDEGTWPASRLRGGDGEPDVLGDWRKLSFLGKPRRSAALKKIDQAVAAAVRWPGETGPLQEVLAAIDSWRSGNTAVSVRDAVVDELERQVKQELGIPEPVMTGVVPMPTAKEPLADSADLEAQRQRDKALREPEAGPATQRMVVSGRDLVIAEALKSGQFLHRAGMTRSELAQIEDAIRDLPPGADDGSLRHQAQRVEEDLQILKDMGERSATVWPQLRESQVAALVLAERRGRQAAPIARAEARARLDTWGWTARYAYLDLDELLDQVHEHLRTGMRLTTNVQADRMARAIADPEGRFHNAWEYRALDSTGSGGPAPSGHSPDDRPDRALTEHKLGYTANVQILNRVYPAYDSQDARDRPKYAALTSRFQPEGLSMYGPDVLVWRQEVRARTTFTPKDSLSNPDAAERVTGPDHLYPLLAYGHEDSVRMAFAEATDFAHDPDIQGSRRNRHFSFLDYFEAQIHGDLGWADVEHVILWHNERTQPGQQKALEDIRAMARDHSLKLGVDLGIRQPRKTGKAPRISRAPRIGPRPASRSHGSGAVMHGETTPAVQPDRGPQQDRAGRGPSWHGGEEPHEVYPDLIFAASLLEGDRGTPRSDIFDSPRREAAEVGVGETEQSDPPTHTGSQDSEPDAIVDDPAGDSVDQKSEMGPRGRGTVVEPRVLMNDEDYELLHRHPEGASLRVRGPRKSRARDRTANEFRDHGLWNSIPPEYRDAAYKQRLEFRDDPQTLRERNPEFRRQLARAGRAVMPDARLAQDNEVLERMGRRDEKTRPWWTAQDRRDRTLTRHAFERLAEYWASATGRSGRPDPERVNADLRRARPTADGQPSAAADLSALLQGHEGVSLGGTHSGSPFWRFTIDNMQMLRDQGVRTIYLESLRDDAYQAMTDEYLETPDAAVKRKLATFARDYDRANALGDRGMTALLRAAKHHNIKVKGISGMPSRRVPGEDLYMRAARMNTYAEQVVRREQARADAGKYIMELGAKHETLHPAPTNPITSHGYQFSQPFPGMSELLGIPPMRLEADTDSLEHLRLRQAPSSSTLPDGPGVLESAPKPESARTNNLAETQRPVVQPLDDRASSAAWRATFPGGGGGRGFASASRRGSAAGSRRRRAVPIGVARLASIPEASAAQEAEEGEAAETSGQPTQASPGAAPSASPGPRTLGHPRQVLGYGQLQGLLGAPGLSRGGELEWEEYGRTHQAVVAVTFDHGSEPELGHAETLVVFPDQPGRSVRDLFSETSHASSFWFRPEVTGEPQPGGARRLDAADAAAYGTSSMPVSTDDLIDGRAQAARDNARRAQRSRQQREAVAAAAPSAHVVVQFKQEKKDLDSTEDRAAWELQMRQLAATITRMVVAAGQQGSWPTVEIVGHGNGTFSPFHSDENRPGAERTGRKRANAVRPVVLDAIGESLASPDSGLGWLPRSNPERREAARQLAVRLVPPGRGVRARPSRPVAGRQVRITVVPPATPPAEAPLDPGQSPDLQVEPTDPTEQSMAEVKGQQAPQAEAHPSGSASARQSNAAKQRENRAGSRPRHRRAARPTRNALDPIPEEEDTEGTVPVGQDPSQDPAQGPDETRDEGQQRSSGDLQSEGPEEGHGESAGAEDQAGQQTAPTPAQPTHQTVLILRDVLDGPLGADAKVDGVGLLVLLKSELENSAAMDLDEALKSVGRLAELVASAFVRAARESGAPEGAGFMLVAATEDGLAASFIASRVANNLRQTVVLAVDGQLDVNICPD
jgi:hypothetical protein